MEFVDDWIMTQTLGEGSFGEVKLLVNRRSGDTVALKSINLRNTPKLEEHNITTEELERMVHKEMTIHVNLNHENIIKFYGSRPEKDDKVYNIYMFLEYAQGGELYDRIEPDIGLTPESKIRPYFTQLINGVAYLHSKGIAHRDLKPENILLDSNDTIKISDFGFATAYQLDGKERLCEQKCGTAPYVAPEVMNKPKYRAPPVDVWSCGIILVTMLTGELPWDTPVTSHSPEFNAWCKGTAAMTNPMWMKMDLQTLNLFKKVLCPIPSKRISIEDVLKHPWMVDSGKSQNNKIKMGPPRTYDEKSLQNLINLVAYSQPDPVISASPNCKEATKENDDGGCFFSFSQPAEGTTEDYFLTTSSASTALSVSSQNNMANNLVKRMTRFFVKTDKNQTFERICGVLERYKLTYKAYQCGFANYNVITVSTLDRRKSALVFKCSLIEMVVDNRSQILVDFRLSRGDGLEFKRQFLKIKEALSDITIINVPITWMLNCVDNVA